MREFEYIFCKTRDSLRRRTIRGTNRDVNRDGATRTRSTAAATTHATRPGTTPAAEVAVRPAGAEARDPARAVATLTPRTHHGGLLVYQRLDKNRSGQHA